MRTLAAVLLALAVLPAGDVRAQDADRRRGFSVRVTEPENNGIVVGRTKIAAEVTIPSPSDLDRVEFWVGDQIAFVDREAPFETFRDFGPESKSWVIRVVAWHKDGFSVSDAVVTRKLGFVATTEVNRVILWATVLTKKDQPVAGLKKEQFHVAEEGKPREILEFYPEDRPITLALLLDSSGSMRESMKELHEAASGFVSTLGEKDRALVIDFDDKVFLLQDLTDDKASLTESVNSTEALGDTAIYDALHAAYRKLRGIEGRKAIVLLSDGDDTSSQFAYDRVLEEAKLNDVLIYTIGLGPTVRKGALTNFADATGGRAFFVGKAKELAGTYQAIAEELRRQYYLTYESPNETYDGRFVPIEVSVDVPDLEVRARKGYFAVRSGQSPREARKATKEENKKKPSRP